MVATVANAAEQKFLPIGNCISPSLIISGLCLIGAFISTGQASALTMQKAIENCRATVGRPIVQTCMRGQGGSGNLEACRALAAPKVHACVQNALNTANGRANVPVAIPAEPNPRGSAGDAEIAAFAPSAVFVTPPRTISDITAILDSEKPDTNKIDELKRKANATPPTNARRPDLARFYYDRGNARAQLGRLNESIPDANKAIEFADGTVDANVMGRFQQFAGLQYSAAGDPKRAFDVFSRQMRDTNAPGAKGFLFGAYRQLSGIQIQMGDVAQAEALLRRSLALIQEARTSGLPGWRSGYALYGQSWESDLEQNRAMIFEARGQYREAETSYRLSEQRRRASVKGILSGPNPPPESLMLQGANLLVVSQARMRARQGRLAEAEVDARRALLAQLKTGGKYNPATPRYIGGLADVLVEQGRYGEAEQLARVALDINRTVGVADDAQSTAQILSNLGSILNLERKPKESAAIYAELDKAIASWDPRRRQAFDLNGSRIYSLYASGQIAAGIAAAQTLLQREISLFGEQHFQTAAARGTLALGYARAGNAANAAREFKAAIPILMTAARENADDDDSTSVAARRDRLKNIVEAYIALLAKNQMNFGGDVAEETFLLADMIRSRSVQQALVASSARMVAKDPMLAALVRNEQDLTKQINAQLGMLNNVLAMPSNERDENVVKTINVTVDKARADRDKARIEIARRFPGYVDLINPKPPTVMNIRDTLRQGEALLSFYFGRDASFVWAVPKAGPVAFAPIEASAGDVESKVRTLREALEPKAAMISDIPAFDLALAYQIYNLLLKPVEAGWKPAKNLIVVTNGALGLLPLALLPTAPAEVKEAEAPAFASYRKVPWLARSHAVTVVPSVTALRTLRQLPRGSDLREQIIGFGDPIFSKEQADEAARQLPNVPTQMAEATTRGMPLKRRASPQLEGVDSAELALLPRLPDTAEELKSIALALNADPSKVLHLGIAANEQTVKSADLSKYKLIVFATHGLAAGELNGLTQPALALSAPDVAGVEGDGLLTMEEILGLKLNADWVVLSACNTGAAAGAGAEAASGLGRAFFYAGTRAILVTNWSVDSQSARELVTDLFRSQASDPTLTRGEALRQAMIALMDGNGLTDEKGDTVFTYAHPLFWAPYTIIGDGD
jgi:CHAT domain-containing protein